MMQARASIVQNIQAGLWLLALVFFAAFAAKASADTAWAMYQWPGSLLILASACALVASALTVLAVIALPAVWAGGRRLDSWSPLRKLFFTLTALIYSGFAVLLGAWGALSPWSG
jgi:hypothetical protein